MTKKKGTNKNKKPEKQLILNDKNTYDEKQQKYEELITQCLKIIKKNNILFITDLVAFLPFGRTTFYEYGLNKSEVIQEAINRQKIFTKQSLRAKFFDSSNPAERLALYKMICTDEERNAISNNPKQEESKAIPEALARLALSIEESVKAYDGNI